MTRSLFVVLCLVACTPSAKDQPCKDQLLVPDHWNGASRLECLHPNHEMKQEGDRWTCRCPKEDDDADSSST